MFAEGSKCVLDSKKALARENFLLKTELESKESLILSLKELIFQKRLSLIEKSTSTDHAEENEAEKRERKVEKLKHENLVLELKNSKNEISDLKRSLGRKKQKMKKDADIKLGLIKDMIDLKQKLKPKQCHDKENSCHLERRKEANCEMCTQKFDYELLRKTLKLSMIAAVFRKIHTHCLLVSAISHWKNVLIKSKESKSLSEKSCQIQIFRLKSKQKEIVNEVLPDVRWDLVLK